MYNSKIDLYISQVIDGFFEFIKDNKEIEAIQKERDFIQSIGKIDNVLLDFINGLEQQLASVINKVDIFLEFSKRHIAYYLFLFIGAMYAYTFEDYISNIIEIMKSKTKIKTEVKDFLNPNSNSKLFEYFLIIQKINSLWPLAQAEKKNRIQSIKDQGLRDFINSNSNLLSLTKTKESIHKVITCILMTKVYEKEKKTLYEMLLGIDDNTVFTYIDVVIPTNNRLDTVDIEDVVPDIKKTDIVYELLNKAKGKDLTIEEKINELINNNLLIPVVDDFLLFHRGTEKQARVDDKKRVDNTKIKFIVSKIDEMSSLYDKKIVDNKKVVQFYPPLADRKAIVVNEEEEIRVINKLQNQGGKSIENNESYNDLLLYRQYPYVNFKTFSKYGFSIEPSKTIMAVRQASFLRPDRNTSLQLRTITTERRVNIIGFIIKPEDTPLSCVKVKDIITVTGKGGYETILGSLINCDKTYFWQLEATEDKGAKLSQEEALKTIVSSIHTKAIEIAYNSIMKQTNDINTLDDSIRSIEKNIVRIPRHNKIFTSIQSNLASLNEIKPDKKKVTMPNLDDTIYLPESKKKKRDQLIEETNTKAEEEKVVVCQHIISWDDLKEMEKVDHNVHSNLLYSFITRYVRESEEKDYLCKSCGLQLEVRDYITSGVYSRTTDKFIAFSTPVNTQLEDIPAYSAFRSSIRVLDRTVENIAATMSLSYYVGESYTVRQSRKQIVKKVIDILLIHNKNMSRIYKTRYEDLSTKYGVSKSLTNTFIFELKNSIFAYSSKDKDKYRSIKLNNIRVYIAIVLLSEVSIGQIIKMDHTKICSPKTFEKLGMNILAGLKILINKNNDTKLISHYSVLSYLIYYFSCNLARSKLWYIEVEDTDMKKSRLFSLKQKSIAHTTIDLMNSIIEIYSEANTQTDKIYEVICGGIFLRLDKVFKEITVKKGIERQGSNIESKSINIGEYKFANYTGNVLHNSIEKYGPVISQSNEEKQTTTNCNNGEFHDWRLTNDAIICTKCKAQEHDQIDSLIINNTMLENMYEKIGRKMCLINKEHKLINDICDCGYDKNKTSITDVIKLGQKIDKLRNKIVKPLRVRETNKIVNDVLTAYTNREQISLDSDINELVSLIVSSIGPVITMNNKKTINVEEDIYSVDHNYYGQPINTVTVNKVLIKKNHSFFDRDVIQIVSTKWGRVDVFYDLNTYTLLGFKKASKEYTKLDNVRKRLTVKRSLKSMIKELGISKKYVDASNITSLMEVKRSRIDRLKKYLREIKRDIQRLRVTKSDLSQIPVVTNTGEKIFNGWTEIVDNLFAETIDDSESFSNNVLVTDILKHDTRGNALLLYIITHLRKLIEACSNDFLRASVIKFIVMTIIESHDQNQMQAYETKTLDSLVHTRVEVEDEIEEEDENENDNEGDGILDIETPGTDSSLDDDHMD